MCIYDFIVVNSIFGCVEQCFIYDPVFSTINALSVQVNLDFVQVPTQYVTYTWRISLCWASFPLTTIASYVFCSDNRTFPLTISYFGTVSSSHSLYIADVCCAHTFVISEFPHIVSSSPEHNYWSCDMEFQKLFSNHYVNWALPLAVESRSTPLIISLRLTSCASLSLLFSSPCCLDSHCSAFLFC